jgi:membrane protein required for colicin V production
MIIDIAFFVLILLALKKGYSKGLIVAVFSLLGFIIGLAAAIKLSAVVAGWLGTQLNVAQQWIPIISFALVFIGVVYLVKLGAALVEKSIKFVMLGWVNKIGGILFYALLYCIVLSIFCFYAKQLNIITPTIIKDSKVYSFIEPIGQKVINSIGTVIPIFKDLFSQLESFFDTVKQTAK